MNEKQKVAFTLAETLLTLIVIGVVAVLTIPSLSQNISNYALEKQRSVFSKKFAEGLRQMRVDDKLSEKYATTADFVNEMEKYFKISKICTGNNLSDCFGKNFTAVAEYNGQITASKEFDLSQIKTTKNLREKSHYDSDIIGIVFSDNCRLLITVNPDCYGPESGNTNGNLYSCIGYVADVNGFKSPNTLSKDIMSNITLVNNFGLSFQITDFFELSTGNSCDANNFNSSEAPSFCHLSREQENDDIVSKYKLDKPVFSAWGDAWGSAMKYCQDKGERLPNEQDFEEIKAKLYDKYCPVAGEYNTSCDRKGIAQYILWTTLGGTYDTPISLWADKFEGSSGEKAKYYYYTVRAKKPIGDYRTEYRYNGSIGFICID